MCERIELVFGIEATVGLFCAVFNIRGIEIAKIRVLSSGTLFQALDRENFRHGMSSTVATVVNLVCPTTVVSLSHSVSHPVHSSVCTTRWA